MEDFRGRQRNDRAAALDAKYDPDDDIALRRLGAPVTSFFRSIGLDVYVVPLGSAKPNDKANWIEKQIKKGYDTVYFMDDSPKNIKAVDNMLTRYPKVNSITKLIR